MDAEKVPGRRVIQHHRTGAVEVMKTGALASVVEFPEAYAIIPRPADGALERWKLLQDLKRATKEALRDNGPYGGVRAGTTAGAV